MRGSYLHLISNTALHITLPSYDIPFTGKHEPNKLTCPQLCDFLAQLVRALHQHRRGHGFESRWVTWIFQVHKAIAYHYPANARIISSFDTIIFCCQVSNSKASQFTHHQLDTKQGFHKLVLYDNFAFHFSINIPLA